jgi:acyl-CoA reductase-like NAD-dependent aldehyde dehydrogenase
VAEAGLPQGTFSLLFDVGFATGKALAMHPRVEAITFTGSREGGIALCALAAKRVVPIPVFAEMGCVNPVLVLPGALTRRGREIAIGLHESFTLGVGQCCTNPGVVLVPRGADGDAFVGVVVHRTSESPAGTMLSRWVRRDYETGVSRLEALQAVRLAIGRASSVDAEARPTVWQTDVERVIAERRLLAEVFGPSTLIVRYGAREDLERFVDAMDGQLTASVQADDADLASYQRLLASLARKVGRVVFNQFPMGVDVTEAMVHGGPFPASSDGRHTSAGARAIERFSRLVSYQNAPQACLPDALKDSNPLRISRVVNGARTKEPIDKQKRGGLE